MNSAVFARGQGAVRGSAGTKTWQRSAPLVRAPNVDQDTWSTLAASAVGREVPAWVS